MTPGFTDGDPFKEFLIFVLVLVVAVIVAATPQVSRWIAGATSRLAGVIRARRAFPEHDLLTSLKIVDASRIIVGLLACWRYGEIFTLALAVGDTQSAWIAGFATACAFLVMIGLATPIAALVLMATSNLLIDNMLGASTLGTMVMAMVLAMFVMVPAGRTLSVDALLLSRTAVLGRWINGMNRMAGAVSADRVLVAKLAAVLAYYCLCLYSVSWHVHDEAWLSGLAIAWIFLSPGANPGYAGFAWAVYDWAPWFFVNISRLSMYGMIVWYVVLLPGLFLGRVVRTFVILWCLAFFLMSAFVLPLSFLGFYELAFWFALFASGSIIGAQPARTLRYLWGKRFSMGMPKWQASAATAPVPPAGQPSISRATPLFGGMLIALVILAGAFLIRLPLLTTASDSQQPGLLSKELVGAAPLGFGIGPINVFNSVDLSLFKIEFQGARRDASLDSEDLALAPGEPLGNLFHLTDRQRYFIIRHARRVSRMNIGCDMQFWNDVAPMYVEALLPAQRADPDSSLIMHARLAPWPTADQLNSYTPSDRVFYPLCSAEIDVRNGIVKRLEYYQEGVDEAARRNDWPPLLEADSLPAALGYACLANAAWLNVVADADQSVIDDPKLLANVRSLFEDRYGEFELSCLFRTVAIMEEHSSFKLDATPIPTPALCDAGIALLGNLTKTAGLSAGLVDQLATSAAEASSARDRGDLAACVQASAMARSDYFSYILKPSALGDLIESYHNNVAIF